MGQLGQKVGLEHSAHRGAARLPPGAGPANNFVRRATACKCLLAGLLVGASFGFPSIVAGQSIASATLERELEVVIQRHSVEIARLEHETSQRIAALRSQIEQLEHQLAVLAKGDDVPRLQAASTSSPAPDRYDRLRIGGDFRLRYESTTAHGGAPELNRGVMRGRVGLQYSITDRLLLGTRLTTGNPDDPNSADISMGRFADDLEVSLDQAYVEYRSDRWLVTAGKFPNPVARMDLVWDGDYNPYGVAAGFRLGNDRIEAGLLGIYSVIDEQTALAGSTMRGAQFSVSAPLGSDWGGSISSGFYDYSIGSLAHADSGDIRDNLLTPDGTGYLSKFRLVDTMIELLYTGWSENWPVRFAGDYVRNLGASVPQDSGFELALSMGSSADVGDWRVTYGYAVNQTDAVLTAFSHDNTNYASNYRQHTLSIDYLPFDKTLLNLTTYFYRRDEYQADYTPDWDQYILRTRMNVVYVF